MRYFPIFLDLQERACLVIGATDEAWRKAEALREAGAAVTTTDKVDEIPAGTYMLAVVATGDLAQDEAAAEHLKGAGALVNVVDRPSLCSFVWPAILDRGPVTIAISTAGTSPTLAKLIRQRIERAVPVAVGELARLAGRLRRPIAAAVPSVAGRRRFWRRVLDGRAGALAFADHSGEARAVLHAEAQAVGVRSLPD